MTTKFQIAIDVNWKKSRTWGHNPTAEVWATLSGVRSDYGTGHASGCGYDKRSTAVCSALRDMPLMQTLMMWPKLNVDSDYGGLAASVVNKRDYGYVLDFAGMGMRVFLNFMRKNGFDVVEMEGDTFDGYVLTRDMPESFVKMVA